VVRFADRFPARMTTNRQGVIFALEPESDPVFSAKSVSVSETDDSSKDRSFPFKDVLAITVGTIALVVSIVTLWFTFFRDVAHLKAYVSSYYTILDTNIIKFAGADAQSFESTEDIILLNDGNKDIVVTNIFQGIAKVGLIDEAADLSNQVLGTIRKDKSGAIHCEKIPGLNGLRSYKNGDKEEGQAPIVILAGRFYAMDKTKFYPMPIFTKTAPSDNKVTMAACLRIEFLKPNGIAGSKDIVAGTFELKGKVSDDGASSMSVIRGGASLVVENID
jgi:hypothetical protein